MDKFKDSELSKLIFNVGEVTLAQNENNQGFLFTKKGYYDLVDYQFHPYLNPVDSLFLSLKNLHLFKKVANGDTIYFVNPSGGYVFEFSNESIKRIDNSSNLRAYFNSNVFFYNNSIYLVGGYGYWKYKSQLIRFDFNLKEWVIVDKLLEDELGFFGPFFLARDQEHLIIIPRDLYHNFKNQKINNNFYLDYNLETKQVKKNRFDFETFDFIWTNGPTYLENYHFSIKENAYVFTTKPSVGFLVFNVENKKVSFKDLSSSYFQSNSNIVLIDNSIYTLVEDKLGNLTHKLVNHEFTNEIHFGDFYSYPILNYTGIGIVILLFLLVLYYKKRISCFILENKNLKQGLLSITLNVDELFFINKLIEKGQVENQDLITYFDRDSKSFDLNVKRKNTMIEKLEHKILSKFKVSLFKKIPSPKDKRQGIYVPLKKLKKS